MEILIKCKACKKIDTRDTILNLSQDTCRYCGQPGTLQEYVAEDILGRT